MIRRSRRPRRNPAARAPKNPMVVVVRRFDPSGEELARWEVLARDPDGAPAFLSLAAAKQAAMRPPRDADLHVGDLLAVVPAEAAAFPEEYARALCVVAPNGVKEAPEPPEELDGSWLATWGHDAHAMLDVSAKVDRRRLVMAACDCAETALPMVQSGESRPLRSIETARAWCYGRASLGETRAAYDAASSATSAVSPAAYAAAAAASAAVRAAYTTDPSEAATWAATWADSVGTPGSASLAPLVERWIPLPVVLLSILGYPDAIPFDPRTA